MKLKIAKMVERSVQNNASDVTNMALLPIKNQFSNKAKKKSHKNRAQKRSD